jgi:hypothetical protein
MITMLLHAKKLTFTHPQLNSVVEIEAPLQHEFTRMMHFLQFKPVT